MADITIVNYERMQDFQKKFAIESEEIAQLYAKLRQMIHNLESKWIGSGADAFFDEMETEILPAVKRLSDALIFTSETTNIINRIYEEAEEEGSNQLREQTAEIGLGSSDFGAEQFGAIGTNGFDTSDVNIDTTDYGANQFSTIQGDLAPNAGVFTNTDYGAGEFLQTSDMSTESNTMQQETTPAEQKAAENASELGSGGGGGSSASGGSGLQGDLDGMGDNLTSQITQSSTSNSVKSSSESAQPMADHLYQSATPSENETGQSASSNLPQTANKQESERNNLSSVASAVGAVGAAGTATGTAKKVIKNKDEG